VTLKKEVLNSPFAVTVALLPAQVHPSPSIL
jgi:hypothetical protein